MTLNIELGVEEELRLAVAVRQNGLAPAELARRLVVGQLPPLAENGGGPETLDASAEQAAGAGAAVVDAEDTLEWDAWTSMPPRRRTGIIRARLQHAGRARPMPADDPWAK
jgi:hypothetical protein